MSSKRKPAGSNTGPVQSELAQLINQAFYYTRRSFDEALRQLGLTAAQAGVLRRIVIIPASPAWRSAGACSRRRRQPS